MNHEPYLSSFTLEQQPLHLVDRCSKQRDLFEFMFDRFVDATALALVDAGECGRATAVTQISHPHTTGELTPLDRPGPAVLR